MSDSRANRVRWYNIVEVFKKVVPKFNKVISYSQLSKRRFDSFCLGFNILQSSSKLVMSDSKAGRVR